MTLLTKEHAELWKQINEELLNKAKERYAHSQLWRSWKGMLEKDPRKATIVEDFIRIVGFIIEDEQKGK